MNNFTHLNLALAEPVEDLSAIPAADGSSSLTVSWRVPTAPLEVVYKYKVFVTNYSLDEVTHQIVDSGMNSTTITGLGMLMVCVFLAVFQL